jgi:hypothetical protein
MENKNFLVIKGTFFVLFTLFIGFAEIPFLYKPFLFWLNCKVALCSLKKGRNCMFTNLELELSVLKTTLFLSLTFFLRGPKIPLFYFFILLILLSSLHFKFNYKISVLIFIGTMVVSYLALFFVSGIENSEIFDMFFSFNNFKF